MQNTRKKKIIQRSILTFIFITSGVTLTLWTKSALETSLVPSDITQFEYGNPKLAQLPEQEIEIIAPTIEIDNQIQEPKKKARDKTLNKIDTAVFNDTNQLERLIVKDSIKIIMRLDSTKVIRKEIQPSPVIPLKSTLKISKKNNADNPCIWDKIFSVDTDNNSFYHEPPKDVKEAIENGIDFLAKQQGEDGGWSAGNFVHYIGNKNKTLEKSDAATTAMVSLALLRNGNTLRKGKFKIHLNKAIRFLLNAMKERRKEYAELKINKAETLKKKKQVKNGYPGFSFISQVQMKLGQHVDIVLSSQLFLNILEYTDHDPDLKNEIMEELNQCVSLVEENITELGSMSDGTWASVLQSALSNNMLECALDEGAHVNREVFQRTRAYQLNNFDSKSGNVKTNAGAGIILYAISGSIRASAVYAGKAQDSYNCAKLDGKIDPESKLDHKILEKIGYSKSEAMKIATAHEIYDAAKELAIDKDVKKGFGNNGGEEFLSFLQTGEAMIISHDSDWKIWYDDTAKDLIKMQQKNGSWRGSHCISSPVFCTATCLLILSINNDIDRLVNIGNGS